MPLPFSKGLAKGSDQTFMCPETNDGLVTCGASALHLYSIKRLPLPLALARVEGPTFTGEHYLLNQELFYGKRKRSDARVSLRS